MSTAVRQRAKKPSSFNSATSNATCSTNATESSHLDVEAGAAPSPLKANHKDHQQLLANFISRRNAVYYLPLLLFIYIVGPTALHVPAALWIWVSHGFETDQLLGAGLKGLVGSMVKDPHKLMIGDVEPPTPLSAYKEVLLEEYETYRQSHEIPIISKVDPGEQGPLDTKGVWKTLFLKAMGRYTCAADHFPKTLEAVRNSGLTAYSIMFSRLAPGQKIEPHTGFSKMIQIYHFALKVPVPDDPEKKPYLNVQECEDEEEKVNCRSERYHWTEGKEFIFDDSFTHYAENPTDEERLVLFLHIKRVDFKGWREELIGTISCYLFSWVPFESVMLLVRGTEKTCAADTTTQ